MADIERWITVNGVHIPIFKGESKMKAVGRFIKGKRKEKIRKIDDKITNVNNKENRLARKLEKMNRDYPSTSATRELAKEYEANREEFNRLVKEKYNRPTIKGYNTDPYNRVNKAQAARLKASRENQWDTDQAYGLLRTIRGDAKEALDNQIDYIYDRQKANPSRLEKAKTRFEVQRLNNEYDAKLANAEYLYGKAKVKQSKAMDDATSRELNKEYRYKLKNSDNRQNNNSKLNPLATNDLKTLTRGAKFLTSAESKIQDFAQVSSSKYNINNITAKELPSGAIHIMTKEGKDISTINPKALTRAEKNTLRRKGILK